MARNSRAQDITSFTISRNQKTLQNMEQPTKMVEDYSSKQLQTKFL